ncbi:Contactin-associated protein-like 2 [Fukomys damarensis]|uniref:Contactin-associated protein-like 2 n=1 Tax=Fukomys damarensis TaxID=885580 RepID=A0A091DWG3_FUKDA|nr:Contactin-associated protein-like 2 [Fukomys damarensis]
MRVTYSSGNREELEGAGGWSPSDSDHYQWLQVDFGNRKQISAIGTQGRYSSSDWVTQYRMLYSDTGRNWKPYHQDGNIWEDKVVTVVKRKERGEEEKVEEGEEEEVEEKEQEKK